MSDRLAALLTSRDNPIVGPNTAQALREWVEQTEAYSASLAYPTQERVENLVARLSLATAHRPTSKDEAAEALEIYWRVLRDIPLVDLARAFEDLIRTAVFMPKPAEIRAKAKLHTNMRAWRLMRARMMIRQHERLWLPPVEPVTPEEIAEIKAQVAQAVPRVDDL